MDDEGGDDNILSDFNSSLSCRNQTEGFFKATDSDYAQNKW